MKKHEKRQPTTRIQNENTKLKTQKIRKLKLFKKVSSKREENTRTYPIQPKKN